MTEDELYNDLPQEPELAFLQLERYFRNECERKISNAHETERTDVFYVDYIAQVLASINELGLEAEFDNRVPRIENIDYDTYLNFSKDVKHYRTMLEIRHGRRTQGYSVRFDEVAKQKLGHHLQQMRGFVEKLEISQSKKEALYAKIEDLQFEINRDRTHFDKYAALTIEAAGVMGEGIEKSRIVSLLDSIARIFWGAKKEEQARLPPPRDKPKLESSRKRIEPPKRDLGLDDDIPF